MPGNPANAVRERVSICIPAWNGRELIGEAVESALEQDYPDVEVVVTDDASDDDTVAYLRRRFGARINLAVSRKRRGPAKNANLSVKHSSGSLIKFLHQDDRLDPDCVSKMTAALKFNPSAGMVFTRRRIVVDADTAASRGWIEEYGDLPSRFSSLKTLNRGSDLIEELLELGLPNWIGEPVCVMVRRSCLDRVGGFHLRITQLVDLELWLRVMADSDVVFIDDELVTYRHSPDSLTGNIRWRRLEWLDRLWMLETLMADTNLRTQIPEIAPRRRLELRGARRALLGWRPWHNDPPIGPWLHYLLYRTLRPVHLARVVGRV